jgi:hypothetical protein
MLSKIKKFIKDYNKHLIIIFTVFSISILVLLGVLIWFGPAKIMLTDSTRIQLWSRLQYMLIAFRSNNRFAYNIIYIFFHLVLLINPSEKIKSLITRGILLITIGILVGFSFICFLGRDITYFAWGIFLIGAFTLFGLVLIILGTLRLLIPRPILSKAILFAPFILAGILIYLAYNNISPGIFLGELFLSFGSALILLLISLNPSPGEVKALSAIIILSMLALLYLY